MNLERGAVLSLLGPPGCQKTEVIHEAARQCAAARKVVWVSLRVNVLHEDVKNDFRFSLEARQGLKELMEAGFENQELAFQQTLAPIADAVRRANERRTRETAG